MLLTREVRFTPAPAEAAGPVYNSWGGWPASGALAPFVVLRATVEGQVDRATGYLCNITVIDQAVRDQAISLLHERWLEGGAGARCERLLVELWPRMASAMPSHVTLVRLQISSSPYLTYDISRGDLSMIAVTRSFEFAAAHRLHCPGLSDDDNRRVFGKCTNPSGHGHNYLLEVTVEGRPDADTGVVIALAELERVVKTHVIDVFDHRHLNEDCIEFAALNPSVENITEVVWGKLEGRFGSARLSRVRVYETPKTWAEKEGRSPT